MPQVAGKAYPKPFISVVHPESGSQSISETLLGTSQKREPHFLIFGGIGVYFLSLAVLLTVDFGPPPMTLESPMEMVYEEPAQPEQPAEPPQPVTPPEKQPEPEPAAEPELEKAPEPKPEPVKEEPPKPPVQTQPEKPKPKPRPPAARTAGAVPSDYANKVYQRINRVASGGFPRSALSRGQSTRISYVIVIGLSGELVSKSVSSSGNRALDQAVSDALARSAPFPAPPNLGARSYRISGAIVYRAE